MWEPLLRRIHASCLLAPLAVWYPASTSAREAGAAGIGRVAEPGDGSERSNDDRTAAERLQNVRRAAAERMGQSPGGAILGSEPHQSGERQSSALSVGNQQMVNDALQQLHGVVCSDSHDATAQQVSSVHIMLL